MESDLGTPVLPAFKEVGDRGIQQEKPNEYQKERLQACEAILIQSEPCKQGSAQEIEDRVAAIIRPDPAGLQQVALCQQVQPGYLLFMAVLAGQGIVHDGQAIRAYAALAVFARAQCGLVWMIEALHGSLSDHLDHKLTSPGLVIEIDIDDLLPGAERQAFAHEGHAQ